MFCRSRNAIILINIFMTFLVVFQMYRRRILRTETLFGRTDTNRIFKFFHLVKCCCFLHVIVQIFHRFLFSVQSLFSNIHKIVVIFCMIGHLLRTLPSCTSINYTYMQKCLSVDYSQNDIFQ